MGATVTILVPNNINYNGSNLEIQIYNMTAAIASASNSENQEIANWYCERCKALIDVNRFESAMEDAKSANFYNPRCVEAYYLAAKLNYQLRNVQDALNDLDKVLALDAMGGTFYNLAIDIKNEIETSLQESKQQANSSTSSSHHSPSLFAWGNGESGQLGIGTLTNKPVPTAVNEFRGKIVQDIACGAMHTCAIVNAGEVYAWGDNSRGQLGYLTEIRSKAVPSLVPRMVGIRVIAISAGAAHTVAVTEMGDVYGWGMASSGQLGPISTGEQCFYEPRPLTCMNGKHVSSVACGLAHTVFLLGVGHVECCGLNNYGQLGISPSSSEDSAHSMQFQPIRPRIKSSEIQHISCGGAHTILIDTDGLVYSSGSNSCGQLGNGTTEDLNCFEPLEVFGSKDKRIAASFSACGEEFTFIITRTRSVYSFGLGLCYQLGQGNTTNISNPTLVAALESKNIESLSCSQGQVYATTASGDVWTWGLPGDKAHMFGVSDAVATKLPEKASEFGRMKRVRQISCGRKHVICSTIVPNGTNCEIVKGLTGPEETEPKLQEAKGIDELRGTDLVLRAGERKLLVLQSRDSNGDLCANGGALVTGRIEHTEVITNQMKNRLLNAGLREAVIEAALHPTVIIDDNMDGSYTCTLRLYLIGLYRFSLFLNSMEVKGSPFDVLVTAGKLSAPNCSVWWGRFAVMESATTASGAGYGTELKCECGDAMAFTVSCRDSFGNKCTDFDGHSMDLKLRNSTNEIVHSSKIVTGSNGIIPCFIQTLRDAPGEYQVSVCVDNDDDNVEGSPFRLTTTERTAPPEVPSNSRQDNIAISAADAVPEPIETISITTQGTETEMPIDAQFLAMHRREITRRRAEDALRKERARLQAEQEERRRQKAVKRTGGGFIIQYSKDI